MGAATASASASRDTLSMPRSDPLDTIPSQYSDGIELRRRMAFAVP